MAAMVRKTLGSAQRCPPGAHELSQEAWLATLPLPSTTVREGHRALGRCARLNLFPVWTSAPAFLNVRF